jgi:hypothetical protein
VDTKGRIRFVEVGVLVADLETLTLEVLLVVGRRGDQVCWVAVSGTVVTRMERVVKAVGSSAVVYFVESSVVVEGSGEESHKGLSYLEEAG